MVLFLVIALLLGISSYLLYRRSISRYMGFAMMVIYVFPFLYYLELVPGIYSLLYFAVLTPGVFEITRDFLRKGDNWFTISVIALMSIAVVSFVINHGTLLLALFSFLRVFVFVLILAIMKSPKLTPKVCRSVLPSFLAISILQVPFVLYEFFVLSRSNPLNMARVDYASGTFGPNQTGTLGLYAVLCIVILIADRQVVKQKLLRGIYFIGNSITLILGFSGGAIVILVGSLLVMVATMSSVGKRVRAIAATALVAIALFITSASLFSMSRMDTSAYSDILEYGYHFTIVEFQNLFDYSGGNKVRGRSYALFEGADYASGSPGGLWFGGGPGSVVKSNALAKYVDLEQLSKYFQVFPYDPVVNTYAYMVAEYGVIFLVILLAMLFYPLLKILWKNYDRVKIGLVLLVVGLGYSYYYNLFFDYQYLFFYLFLTQLFYRLAFAVRVRGGEVQGHSRVENVSPPDFRGASSY